MTTRTVVGLLVAIAATDLLTTRLEPPHSDAILKVLIVAGFLTLSLIHISEPTRPY